MSVYFNLLHSLELTAWKREKEGGRKGSRVRGREEGKERERIREEWEIEMKALENEIERKKMKGPRENKQESPEQQEGIGHVC